MHFKGQIGVRHERRRGGRVPQPSIGFVFQSHYLLPEFTAAENVAMPALIQRQDRKAMSLRAQELLERVGLGAPRRAPPRRTVGRRVAAGGAGACADAQARPAAGRRAHRQFRPYDGRGHPPLLREVNRDLGITAVVVTHNETLGAIDAAQACVCSTARSSGGLRQCLFR